jgi:hypothetical protein
MSNLLAMPLVQLAIETGTNEDWIDSIKFLIDEGAGSTSGPSHNRISAAAQLVISSTAPLIT